MNKYSIEWLIENFEKHAEKYENELNQWIESKPDVQEINTFNLPLALLVICDEVRILRLHIELIKIEMGKK